MKKRQAITHSSTARKTRARRLIPADTAAAVANKHLILRYPLGLLAATPSRLTLAEGEFWIVPVVLTSTGYGAVGVVGMVAVDARSGEVRGSTPTEEVVAKIKRWREEKRDGLPTRKF